ncbi:MAG: hydroxyacid dehydrogenase [Phycisphaerae bacterium]|nr:hydroxyacid dehydrogenase [Phycisphaerae bacterium]
MKILLADKIPDFAISRLKSMGCEVFSRTGLTGKDLADAVAETGCEVLVVRSTKVPRPVLEAGHGLKLVIRAGSGFDTIDVAAADELGIRVCNCPGMNSVAVAELTIGLMIALDRQIVDETDDLRRGVWNKKKYSSEALGLKGRTLGIIGLGCVGQEVACRAAAFGMNVMYYDVIRRPELEKQLGVKYSRFDDLIEEADFITLHVPGGMQTRHMIGRRELALMKPTAYLVNCSRGGVVDETALAESLRCGDIAGAALDVYELEPTATDPEFKDPISHEPHLYGTHHVGASTHQAQDAVAEEMIRVIAAYRDHDEFLHCVNPEKVHVVGG